MNSAEQLIDPVLSVGIFKEWETMLQENKRSKQKDLPRLMPLLEFDLTNKNKVPTVDWD